MDDNEMTNGAAAPENADGASATEMERDEALHAAFCKGWDSAIAFRQEHGDSHAEKGATGGEGAADENTPPPFIYDPITQEINERAERAAAHKALIEAVMGGPDMASWIAPQEGVVSDELLVEHLAQLRKAVRYALTLAFEEGSQHNQSLSAVNTATRMIRASIALTKELKASKSKTVRGGGRARRTQD